MRRCNSNYISDDRGHHELSCISWKAYLRLHDYRGGEPPSLPPCSFVAPLAHEPQPATKVSPSVIWGEEGSEHDGARVHDNTQGRDVDHNDVIK